MLVNEGGGSSSSNAMTQYEQMRLERAREAASQRAATAAAAAAAARAREQQAAARARQQQAAAAPRHVASPVPASLPGGHPTTRAAAAPVAAPTSGTSDAAFRRQERQDEHAAELKSPASMAATMQETRDAKAVLLKAQKKQKAQPTAASKAVVEKAANRYGTALDQQVRIAVWRAQTQGGDVHKAIKQQARFAADLGGGSKKFNEAAGSFAAKAGQKGWNAEKNADVRAVQITQAGWLRGVDPAGLQRKAQQDAQRVSDLNGYGSGYVTQAAQDEAGRSAHDLAQVVAKNDAFELKKGELKAQEKKDELAKVAAMGNQVPAVVTAPARKKAQAGYDRQLESLRQLTSQADLSAGVVQAEEAQARLAAAERAYVAGSQNFVQFDGNAITDYNKMSFSNGYDPTADMLPPTDFEQKVLDGNSANEAAAGTKGAGPGIYQMKDGTRVQRGADGQWTVLNRGYDTVGRLAGPRAMNPMTEAVWESRYQATRANEQLDRAVDYADMQRPADLAADLTGTTTRQAQAVDAANRSLATDRADQSGTRQQLEARAARSGADLEYTNQVQQWQAADRAYQEARLAGRDALAEREAADDAYVRVLRAKAGVEVAQSKDEMAVEKQAQDAFDARASRPQVASRSRYREASERNAQALEQFNSAQAAEVVTAKLSRQQINDPVAIQAALPAEAGQEAGSKGHRADSLLESLVGGLEVVGGVALGAAAGWTGVGAVAAGALIIDGGTRFTHGAVDAAKDEKTDPYLSQALQAAHVGQGAANRIDTAVGMSLGLVGGGSGTVRLAADGVRAANAARTAGTAAKFAAGGKLAGGIGSTLMLADSTQSQGRYVATGRSQAAFATQGLMKIGLSETQANYAQVLGGLGVGTAVKVHHAWPKIKGNIEGGMKRANSGVQVAKENVTQWRDTRAGFQPGGMPKRPDTVGGSRYIPKIKSWQEAARNAHSLLTDPNLKVSKREEAVRNALAWRPRGAHRDERFIVSDAKPHDVMYGKGGKDGLAAATTIKRVSGPELFESFEAARKAAEKSNGAQWVYRVTAKGVGAAKQGGSAGLVPSREVLGALHVDAQGKPSPLALPNVGTRAWLNRRGRVADVLLGRTINPRAVVAGTVALKGGTALLARGAGIDWPYNALSGPEPSTFGFWRGAYSRLAWFTHGHGFKRTLDRAAFGDPEKLKDAIATTKKMILRAKYKGAKTLEPADIDALLSRMEAAGQSAQALRTALGRLAGAPDMKQFRTREIRPTAETHVVPKAWLKSLDRRGVAATLKEIRDLAPDQFKVTELNKKGVTETRAMTAAEVRKAVLAKLDSLDAQGLEDAFNNQVDASNPAALLLQKHPQLKDALLNSVDVRSDIRKLHADLYEKLKPLMPARGLADRVDAQIAEELGGSATTPATKIGNLTRKVALNLSVAAGLNWAFKPYYLAADALGHVYGAADGLAFGTAAVIYKYSKAVDALTEFDAKHSKAELEADAGLTKKRKELADEKDKWNKFGDAAGAFGVARSLGAGFACYSSGLSTMGHLYMAQAGFTAGWIAVQRPLKFLTPAKGPRLTTLPQGFKTAVRLGAIGALVVVPSATYVMKAAGMDNRQKEEQTPAEMLWSGIMAGLHWGAEQIGRIDYSPVPAPSRSASAQGESQASSAGTADEGRDVASAAEELALKEDARQRVQAQLPASQRREALRQFLQV